MPDDQSPSPIDLNLDAQVLERLCSYASKLGVSPETVLVLSVLAFMDTHPLCVDDVSKTTGDAP